MIDIELFRKLLSSNDGYIETGDKIPIELFELMYSSPVDKVKALFLKKKNRQDKRYVYDVEIRCPECGKVITKRFNKKSLLRAISIYRGGVERQYKDKYLCPDCSYEEKRRRKENQENSVLIKENTDLFIQLFLNKNKELRDDRTLNKRFYRMLRANVDWGEVRKFILDLDYKDFLQTPYWRIISDKVKQKAKYRCMICNSNKNLSTHHRCYTHHGDEIHHLEDLICICQECHNKHHFE